MEQASPQYENILSRLGSQITPNNTEKVYHHEKSSVPRINPNYVYIVIPIIVATILFMWNPTVLHVDLPQTSDSDGQHHTKLSKVRLVLSTVVISLALFIGWYMYNMKRKTDQS